MTHKQIDGIFKDQGTFGGQVPISGAQQIIMTSREGNQEYQIFVFKPNEEPPPSGYPVIYVLDANSVFGTFVESVRLQSSRPEKTGVVPAIIVGIGYVTDELFSSSRHYDFTMPGTVPELNNRPDGTPWPRRGGAEYFLKFIEEDLKPKIQRYFRIDNKRETLFGHSLGGLFVLQILYTRPDLFNTFASGSPSIYFNKNFFLENEKGFQYKLRQQNINVDVFVGVGELEKDHRSNMTDNAREFSSHLSALKGCGVRTSEFVEFEGESHLSVLLPFINRVLRFALNPNDTKQG